jgi:putative acetyltransferase
MSPALRRITPADDPQVAAVIRTVMTEFGASGPGFAIHDPEVDHMSAAYASPGAAYFVVEHDGVVMGGGGIAPLDAADPASPPVCELRKMYFLPRLRGMGAGRLLIDRCLTEARSVGYRRCYLETLTGMDAAIHLYERTGFTALCAPLGATGHFGCDRWFVKDL